MYVLICSREISYLDFGANLFPLHLCGLVHAHQCSLDL